MNDIAVTTDQVPAEAIMPQRPFDPRQNQLLAKIPDAIWQRWLPHLEFVAMPAGHILCGAGLASSHAFFPTAGIVSLANTTQDGHTTQLAMVGSEGFVGVEVLLRGRSMLNAAVVQSAGEGSRLEVSFLEQELADNGPVMHLLLRYTQALITQMAQAAVCNRHHTVEQQLCRWLLLSLDRLQGNEMLQTHESISNALGVRREGITESASKLQRDQLIHYARGRIIVLNRDGIEQRACECYTVVKKEYKRLLPQTQAS